MTAQAVVIDGLGSDSRLYSFGSAAPGSVAQIGASAGLVDIDFHGANGLLDEASFVGCSLHGEHCGRCVITRDHAAK